MVMVHRAPVVVLVIVVCLEENVHKQLVRIVLQTAEFLEVRVILLSHVPLYVRVGVVNRADVIKPHWLNVMQTPQDLGTG